MIVRAGFQNFELQQSYELPKPITFASHDAALNWLKQIGFMDRGTIVRLRECVARFSNDPDHFRLTDQQVVERMAAMLYSRKVLIVAREERGISGSPTPKEAPNTAAFPLSERTSRAPSTSPKPAPVEDP